MKPKCPKCQEVFTANGGGHCRACCRTFTSDSAAMAHRRGPFENRVCLSVEETDGWRLTKRGWTNAPEFDRSQIKEDQA